jgi:manganese/iron transport system ATP-binding protein
MTLQIKDLHVELGGRLVVRDVSLSVASGEFVGLLGPNGAGKTTLLRAVMGLVRTRSGVVAVDGQPVRRRDGLLGYVPQRHEFAWDFPISVEDAVRTGRSARIGWLRRPGVADYKAVGDALERVRLTPLRRRPVGALSGGQRQRVLVARALALAPAVLLLDEPFTGLDMPTQELLTELFQRLASEGHGLLMTTHDLPSAVHTCDRLALLNRTITADGTPAELTDAEVWRTTFGISEGSPTLRMLRQAALEREDV